jgi:hypothetical protein
MANFAAGVSAYANDTFYIVTCGTGSATEVAIDTCNAAGTTCYASWCYSGACAGYVLLETSGNPAYCPNGAVGQKWH